MSNFNFKSAVKRILKEEVEKSSTATKVIKRLPEVETTEDLKKVSPHPIENKTKTELLDDITKLVKEINTDYIVEWDDHDDIFIHAEDLKRIRIIPKWENNYGIEIYTQNEDRVYITGQTWNQVKSVVKENIKDTESHVEKTYKKSIDNYKLTDTKEADKGIPQKDKPVEKKVTDIKNKEKNYIEKAVTKEDDLQSKPMKEVGTIKKQDEHPIKGTKPDYKYPKQKDKKLLIKQK